MNVLYNNPDFSILGDEILEYLAKYEGLESYDEAKMSTLIQHLNEYGWVLSPRLWTHEEILLICIITMDNHLLFDDIQGAIWGTVSESQHGCPG
jgi:hypothetical protein